MNDFRPEGGEVAFLRACPQQIAIHRTKGRLSAVQAIYATLSTARLISGTIDVEKSTRDVTLIYVTLTNDGRRAIGLPIHGGSDADQHA